MDALGWDLRNAVRSLRRSPGFVLVSTLTLGLALGLGVTTYAMLDAVRHPYTPVKEIPQATTDLDRWSVEAQLLF